MRDSTQTKTSSSAITRTDSPKWAKAGGVRLRVYSNSMLLTMGTIFLLSWLAQSLAGHVVANDVAVREGGALRFFFITLAS